MTDAMQRLSEAVGNVRDVVVQQATRRMEELEQAPEFNPVVFWSVNAIWITVLAVLVIWLWKFNGAERLQRWTRAHANRDSDQELAARLRRRREQEEESKKISPEEHAEMLGKTFREKKVHMVRYRQRHCQIAMFVGFLMPDVTYWFRFCHGPDCQAHSFC
mmetsp:Transcript_18404/g.42634  ORF Transcript_18404/g.42634 Transcript_18404/m.42634 type:complete len:161 (+) Transcript_18404:153-635(+)